MIFIDADPQQSASAWIKELSTPVRIETLDAPKELIRRVAELEEDADDIVIDGPAGLSETTRAIMLRADKVFLPCGPSIRVEGGLQNLKQDSGIPCRSFRARQ